MKQVLAVLAAVALIGGAWFVRTEFIAPTDDTGGATQVDDVAEEPATGLDVVCDELLGDACPAGSVRRDSADLVEAFSIPEVPHDVLVAPAIVVQMIEESGRSSATLSEERPTVATTPIVLVVAAGRDADVTACGTTWTCASTLVTAGDLRPAFADPSTDTAGITGLAALAGGYFNDAGAPFNLTGFSTGGFIGWLDAVQRESTISPSGVENIIRFAGSQNDSAVVTEAEALDVTARAAQNVPVILYPEPIGSLSVVAVAVGDTDHGDAADVGEQVGAQLRDAGWRGPDGASSEGGPALGGDDGLPSGGVLIALRQRWGQ
ncbi:hypothetical protein DVS28_a4058 [Euzebya pacifica]|uniref:Uncharacterized protein n=1 Tax=Euzebya pacifica TaxID=1608957 RepID=A0A346Y2M9_9ACTN|nr:substrate-binding domain-containing protein [Euzebya pacifica]AXV08726.1 hypothetical protein DVS28_a4058 [Euzebya pacifica]